MKMFVCAWTMPGRIGQDRKKSGKKSNSNNHRGGGRRKNNKEDEGKASREWTQFRGSQIRCPHVLRKTLFTSLKYSRAG